MQERSKGAIALSLGMGLVAWQAGCDGDGGESDPAGPGRGAAAADSQAAGSNAQATAGAASGAPAAAGVPGGAGTRGAGTAGTGSAGMGAASGSGTGGGGASPMGGDTGDGMGGSASDGGATASDATTADGGLDGGGTAGRDAGDATPPAPGVTKDADALLSNAGLTDISYGGYLNGESFQQDGVLSFNGYQYAAFWNTARHVVLARRALPDGAWSTIELTDYTNGVADAHNTISLGISPRDGVLHLSFDHHGDNLHYRRSTPGLLTNPATADWAPTSFTPVSSALAGATPITQVTYPRFVTEPGGDKLLFEARIGASGAGDQYLWEYDATDQTWTALGKYIDGIRDSVNAYPHGLAYTPDGTRLHMAWCWRDNPDAASNHDLLYIYSDDHGRTWKNDAGATVATTGQSAVTRSSPGINVYPIRQNRGLINQEHMTVDRAGRVHVLLSHMPDALPDDANFESARSKSRYFHYVREADGTWQRNALDLRSIENFRGKLAVAPSGNLYAILPDLRVAGASPTDAFATWALLDDADAGRFFSDPLIDTARLLEDGTLTIFYPARGSANLYILDYAIE